MIVTGYALKVGNEVLVTPLIYTVIHLLKQVEGGESDDSHTSFNPFGFSRDAKAQ